MAALSSKATKRLMIATTDADVGKEIADAVNKGEAIAAPNAGVALVAAIQATSTSQTTDFAVLKVDDKVAMIPATAGNADYISITTAGDLGQAAVIGNLYLVFRPITLPAASSEKF